VLELDILFDNLALLRQPGFVGRIILAKRHPVPPVVRPIAILL
jgi:hypothetical protein